MFVRMVHVFYLSAYNLIFFKSCLYFLESSSKEIVLSESKTWHTTVQPDGRIVGHGMRPFILNVANEQITTHNQGMFAIFS